VCVHVGVKILCFQRVFSIAIIKIGDKMLLYAMLEMECYILKMTVLLYHTYYDVMFFV